MQQQDNIQIYREFFEHTLSANIIYGTDDKGKSFYIRDINAVALKQEKWIKEDVIGKKLQNVFEGVKELGLCNLLRDVLFSGKAKTIPEALYKKNKLLGLREHKIIKLSNDSIVKMSTDKIQENEFQFENIKLNTVLNNAPISIVVTDLDGNLIYVNPWFSKVTGYSFEEAIGENPRILKTGFTSDEEYLNMWEDIKAKSLWKGIFKNKRKNGETYWESAIIVPVKDSYDKTINYLGIKQEITNEVYLQEVIKEKEEIIISQSRYAAMHDLLGIIAHQWKQPLSSISMGINNIITDVELELLKEEELLKTSTDILKQVQKLSLIIDDFRNYFQSEDEKSFVEPSCVVAEALKMMEQSLKNNAIEYKVNNNNDTEIEIFKQELLQVFLNILINAKESLVLTKDINKEILVDINNIKNEFIEIKICNNGKEISRDIIHKIFEPYVSTKEDYNGKGLGLYITKTIVESRLNGEIEVHNTANGVCFTIKIYLKEKLNA